MKASKQDYEAFVKVIRSLEAGRVKRLMWAIAIADILEKGNTLFNRQIFIDAVEKKNEGLTK